MSKKCTEGFTKVAVPLMTDSTRYGTTCCDRVSTTPRLWNVSCQDRGSSAWF